MIDILLNEKDIFMIYSEVFTISVSIYVAWLWCGVISLWYVIEWEIYLYDIFNIVYAHVHTHTQRERERERVSLRYLLVY